ncbi:hypothetical protein NA56DRAFT_23253 [Hyaloscypha hepaticicola]|uniref:Uncharacterized protein n=1 Tax=Hyaloscypha hepaticicola TaxID=2082293 RepID=A0A2J6QCP0_9HELO|nr:hypothetical protein NA56DRAFT_23253 [Hyaloscypha hepaticicola]
MPPMFQCAYRETIPSLSARTMCTCTHRRAAIWRFTTSRRAGTSTRPYPFRGIATLPMWTASFSHE